MNDDWDTCDYCGGFFDVADLLDGLCPECDTEIEAEWESTREPYAMEDSLYEAYV